ncbi:serine/threonine-protein phosphatase 6 regulatory ankyrin repeat subunit B-like [Daphnia pulicaria]|uniref:serine/threonine-protein phosphatase 6 regulatory ankyrin repeat subunit B-like n=1 Tax=Daphnia pulicaria TaxID=35523 RepID=UPI001EECD5C7|nr:serine/threonine-protein phosphatase 6 regulatory ankyrin repeat subunit B-like [Daphnia pulicaria]
MPDAADTKPKVGHEMSEAATNLLFSMLCGLLVLCVMCFVKFWRQVNVKYWQKVSDLLPRPVQRFIGRVLASLLPNIPFVVDYIGAYFGAKSQQKLLFVPDADNEPKVDHEISEPVLFRFLLNEETLKQLDQAEIHEMLNVLKDVDKGSKITEFETHQSSMDLRKDSKGAFHVFIVFKTTSVTDGDYWWSIEKGMDYITLQRSRNKENVKNQCYGEPRHQAKPIVENLIGKGTIQDLFAVLWAQQMIPEKYNALNSNCQTLVTFVSQQITEIGYEYKGFFAYSPPPENGRNKKMLDLINILRGRSDWPPLFTLILMENIHLVGKMIDSGKYNINAFYNGLTPLHFAIMFSKNKMVQHLLKDPTNADPTTRDPFGRSALLFAAMFTMKMEIIDSLLAHPKVKVNDVDEDGRTALHSAAGVSNAIAVRKLIEKGANPNIVDKNGTSPLHLAAQQRDDYEIIDLLLAHPKVNVDDVDGEGHTALHFAIHTSNVIAVQKFIDKGANPNILDKEGLLSPLHVAAQQRDGNPMIDLLLEAQKVKGLGDVNDRNKQGKTALHYAAGSSNEITAEHLIELGADLHCRDNNGDPPLHVAAIHAKDMNIIDLLLKNMKQGDIEQYRNDKGLVCYAKMNCYGLDDQIVARLVEKGIEPSNTEPTVCSQEIDNILKEGNFDVNSRDQNEETLLFFAIRANNVNGVRFLLERGADPTVRNIEGNTLFHTAALFLTDSDVLGLMLVDGKKIEIDIRNKEGDTALHYAIMQSNVPVARFLLSNGASPNVADENGYTPLRWAIVFAKDMEMVKLLLNHEGTNVNCLDKKGNNVLDYAMNIEHRFGEEIVNLLLAKGAVENKDKLKRTENNEYLKKHMRAYSNRKPHKVDNFLSDDTKTIEDKIEKISEESLLKAIKDSNVERVRLLLKNGAHTSARGEMGKNALHLASLTAKTTDLIDALLETEKFDISGTDNRGNTPLHHAILGSNCEINTRHLIGKGADPTIANKKGFTPLHYAARYAKTIETIRLIMENKQVDISSRDVNGWTPLHHAIKAKNLAIARCLLLEKGVDPTIRNNEGDTPFHLAAEFLTDSNILGLMLGNENQIDIDEGNNCKSTALHVAIVWSNMTAARFLLSKGANPNVADENGVTPLHFAAYFSKDMDIVELLLNHKGTNVNCLDNKGTNALDYAMKNIHGNGERMANRLKEKGLDSQTGNSLKDETEFTFQQVVKAALDKAIIDSEVGMTRFLIEKGADISTVTWGAEGWNALHAASIDAKTTEILDVILETGKFDINGGDVSGKTAVYLAIVAKNMTTARHLLTKGADPTISDENGIIPLHLAACHATTTDIIKLILKNNLLDINSRDVNGWTPLHHAIGASNLITARYLLEKGADPATRDYEGYTLFHTAAILNKDNVLGLMMGNEKKLNLDVRNKEGDTALHYAIMQSNVPVARFLLSNGANPNVADNRGATPLHLAALCANDMEMVKLLLNYKTTKVNCLDNEGNNALQYAMTNKHGLGEAIASLLR